MLLPSSSSIITVATPSSTSINRQLPTLSSSSTITALAVVVATLFLLLSLPCSNIFSHISRGHRSATPPLLSPSIYENLLLYSFNRVVVTAF
ncbi:hypothetical protein BHE74_00000463 [Ensete ventricosum]|nr:hypothetical protein GW17_00021374 [Ensete ventricosum]RWW90424.1 hypothetical protein BHE74_00000463 [Ensete ventricosum]